MSFKNVTTDEITVETNYISKKTPSEDISYPIAFVSGSEPHDNFRNTHGFVIGDYFGSDVAKQKYAKLLIECYDSITGKHNCSPSFFVNNWGQNYYDFLRSFANRTDPRFSIFNLDFTHSEDILINTMISLGTLRNKIIEMTSTFLQSCSCSSQIEIASIHLFIHSKYDLCTMCSKKFSALSNYMNCRLDNMTKSLRSKYNLSPTQPACVTSSRLEYEGRRRYFGIDKLYNDHLACKVYDYAKCGYYVQTLVHCNYSIDPVNEEVFLATITFSDETLKIREEEKNV